MFWVISKILIPLSGCWFWVALLLLIALISRNKNVKKWMTILSLSLFLFLLNSGIIGMLMKQWEIRPLRSNNIQTVYEYGIVLGGFAAYNPADSIIEFNNSSDRLNKTIELYKQGKIKKIIVSGGEGTLIKTGKTEAEITGLYLHAIGIPDSVVILEQQSKNTIENVLEIKKLIKTDGRNCLLITSGYHMRRSLAIFKKHGMQPVACACDMRSGDFSIFDFFVFKSDSLSNWDALIHEVLGYWVYKMMGYV